MGKGDDSQVENRKSGKKNGDGVIPHSQVYYTQKEVLKKEMEQRGSIHMQIKHNPDNASSQT